MKTSRLEAFSDGFLSICITIMVLELEAPHGTGPEELRSLLTSLLSYVLSFVYLGIYWNNHHHLIHAAGSVDGRVLWANLHLLFWLSLISFSTRWMAETEFAALPVAAYGLVLLMAAIAYFILTRALVALQGAGSVISRAVGGYGKEFLSLGLYASAFALAFVLPLPLLSLGLYALVAVLWLIPDRRIERSLREEGAGAD